jgi:hypothetical protein
MDQRFKAPQSDPEELEHNIELWKQWEASASCKHMLALERKANRVERELGQLYKEQQLQEELNMAIEWNRQSHNTLSSYQCMRAVGLSEDTHHEQRGTLGAPQESVLFRRELLSTEIPEFRGGVWSILGVRSQGLWLQLMCCALTNCSSNISEV